MDAMVSGLEDGAIGLLPTVGSDIGVIDPIDVVDVIADPVDVIDVAELVAEPIVEYMIGGAFGWFTKTAA